MHVSRSIFKLDILSELVICSFNQDDEIAALTPGFYNVSVRVQSPDLGTRAWYDHKDLAFLKISGSTFSTEIFPVVTDIFPEDGSAAGGQVFQVLHRTQTCKLSLLPSLSWFLHWFILISRQIISLRGYGFPEIGKISNYDLGDAVKIQTVSGTECIPIFTNSTYLECVMDTPKLYAFNQTDGDFMNTTEVPISELFILHPPSIESPYWDIDSRFIENSSSTLSPHSSTGLCFIYIKIILNIFFIYFV